MSLYIYSILFYSEVQNNIYLDFLQMFIHI